jgi:hypothetical protein
LSDGERAVLAEIGQKLGKKAREEMAHIATPDTILGWRRKLSLRNVMAPHSARLLAAPKSPRSCRRADATRRSSDGCGGGSSCLASLPSRLGPLLTVRLALQPYRRRMGSRPARSGGSANKVAS